MTPPARMPLEITVVSDVICPWCFIGSRRLAQVLEDMADVVEPRLHYRAFLLDPTVPPEGVDLRDRLRRKYGVDPEAMFTRIEQAAHDVGIPIDYATIQRTPNTIPAHTLLRAAGPRGTQAALSGALFEAYFLSGLDISDAAVLAAIGEAHGFSRAEVAPLVTDPVELEATRAEATAAAQAGVDGVPFFVFGNRLALSGAQPAHVFRRAIAQAIAG